MVGFTVRWYLIHQETILAVQLLHQVVDGTAHPLRYAVDTLILYRSAV